MSTVGTAESGTATGTAQSTAPGARRRPVPADLLTIGEVLGELREDFPDVSHSKIRFLEDRGLVTPARTPSGYRKFSRPDVARLRLVLSLQRDHYLPLRVIGEHVAALDAGRTPPRLPGDLGAVAQDDAAARSDGADAAPVPAQHGQPNQHGQHDRATRPEPGPAAGAGAPRRLDRGQLVALAGGDSALVDGLESHGLLPRPGAGGYPGGAGEVVAAARQLGGFGIEPRHLRVLRTAAEREAALVEQVVSPLRRSPRAGGEDRADRADRAAEVSDELAATLLRLHGSLLRSALDGAQG